MSISHQGGATATETMLGLFARYATIFALVAMMIVFSILSPSAFPTVSNFVNVLNQGSLAMIIAVGLTMTVMLGELDLSIGATASLCGILVVGLMTSHQLSVPVAIVITIGAGGLIGVVNGLLVTKLRVNSVVATLGVATIVSGLSFAYTAGSPIVSGVPDSFVDIALGKWIPGVPNNIVIMVLVAAALWFVVECTPFGQRAQAVGGNLTAARLAGINADRIKISGFVASGACAAVTGVLLASRLGSGTPGAGDSYLLTAFAAVFLGSATLRDGEFHVPGTVIGALIIAFGFNGLNIFGAPTFSQYLLQGTILIVAVGLSSFSRALAER